MLEDFKEKYKPIRDNEEDCIKQFDWTVDDDIEEILIATNEKRLCTVRDSEDGLVLNSGYHYVDRLFYVVTEVPIEEEINLIY